jgi:hypothetical protein
MIGTYFPSGQTDEWLRWLDLYCIQRAEGEGAWPRLCSWPEVAVARQALAL